MAWSLNLKTVGAYTEHFEFLDGDRDKITNPDQSVDVGVNPPDGMLAPFCGRPIDPTHLPTRLRPKGGRHKMGDMVGAIIGTLVSEKVKRIVEKLEPGVHAFYPVVFEWKNGAKETGHSVWIIQNSIKALHPDLIDPPYTGPNDYWDGMNIVRHPGNKVVFSKEKIGNAHAWSDPQLTSLRFVSDELADAFKAAEVSGFAPRRHIDVV